MVQVSKNILKNIYKKRPADSKKYDYGLVLVIGGSQFYSGSPAFAALAAFRAGADMVHIIAPKRAADIIASFSPDLAAYPLEGKWLEKKHLSTLISMTESAKAASRNKTAVVIGGGMGRSEETQEAILEYLSQVSVPVVIDADAIHALAKNPEVISGKPSLITPHSYEFYVLTGKNVRRGPTVSPVSLVQEEAQRLKTVILLKGETDIISDGKRTAQVKAGTPYMTTGGTGDTLAGIAGALLARGISPFQAGQAAVYINGKAGEMASEKFGESLTATDLIKEIPFVI
ncbi:MAG: NAD(P)H-hydrate dehydratase [Candidatus Aminicenantales bacterium]